MSFLLNILKSIWAVWCVLVFIFYNALVIPIYLIMFLIMGKRAHRPAHYVSRAWAASILVFFGVDIKRKGGTPPDRKKTYIFISNHNSLLDIPICAVVTNNYFKFLAKEELTKVPLLGPVIKHLYITVSRESIRNRGQSIARMKEALNEGTSVWIYPEGTRNKTSKLLNDFHDGAFKLAAESGFPIAILALYDTKLLQPPGKFQLSPGIVKTKWAGIITCPEGESDKAGWLKEKSRELLNSALAELKGSKNLEI